MEAIPERFCFQDPSSLFRSMALVPHSEMTEAERLNVLVRWVILITLLLFLFRVREWWIFFLGGLLIVFFFWMLTSTPGDGTEYLVCWNPPSPEHIFSFREDLTDTSFTVQHERTKTEFLPLTSYKRD